MSPAARRRLQAATLARFARPLAALAHGLVPAHRRAEAVMLARLGCLVALEQHGPTLTRRDALAGARAEVDLWIARGCP